MEMEKYSQTSDLTDNRVIECLNDPNSEYSKDDHATESTSKIESSNASILNGKTHIQVNLSSDTLSTSQIMLNKTVQTVNDDKTKKEVKRNDYLIWEDYFMSVAILSAKRSKDPSTQVGACIVNDENKIVSIGYNGMPINCNDDLLPWGKSSQNPLENKYLYVCHAELNSVLNCNTFTLKGCTIYVTLFPCNECAKVIIQSGIRQVYYLDKKKEDKPEYIASKRLLDMANVKLVHYKPKEKLIVLNLNV